MHGLHRRQTTWVYGNAFVPHCALVAIIVAGFGINWLFFANPAAEAQPEPRRTTTNYVPQMQRHIKSLPCWISRIRFSFGDVSTRW
jgi:hypothetical protein